MSNVTFEMIAVSLAHALQWNFKLILYTTNTSGVSELFLQTINSHSRMADIP